jgi:hypothetical protein
MLERISVSFILFRWAKLRFDNLPRKIQAHYSKKPATLIGASGDFLIVTRVPVVLLGKRLKLVVLRRSRKYTEAPNLTAI